MLRGAVLPGLLFAAIILAGCESSGDTEGPVITPTSATLLSTGSPTKDEDPSVLLAQDGSLCVAWYSDRDAGNQELYITRTVDGITWSPAVRVTNDPGGDFYPSLIQDDLGVFHLTWFRWTALFVGQIMYKTSADPDCTKLAMSVEVAVTNDPNVDDWVPVITKAADGTLLIYFVSEKRNPLSMTNEIYVSTKGPGDPSWNAPQLITGISSPTEHDHLPFVARTGPDLAMVWVRNDGTSLTPWVAPLPKSDLWYSTSTDGLTWGAPTKITNEPAPAIHLYPGLYQRFDGTWWIIWLSTRLNPGPPTAIPSTFEFPLARVSPTNLYPTGIEENTLLTAGTPGYSHRITRTSTAGVYLGTWVHGTDPAQDIYYRFFNR
jgi:hypothetical protein